MPDVNRVVTALRLDPRAVLRDLDELAEQSGGRFAGAKRLAWTPEWQQARVWLEGRLAEVGLTPERDVAGNIWANLPGEGREFLILGSHIDAVPDGGWLDGALGVLTAVEAMRQLAKGPPPPLTVRFVDWADEEGARFGRSLLGSSACAGTLDPDEVRSLTDSGGVSLVDAMAACGIDLDSALKATNSLSGAAAYLELHIEQGPALLERNRLASAVSGTLGVERHLMTFTGQAAHAGSTPMAVRRDSLAAASAATLALRENAIQRGGVATVGSMRSTPGVITAIAGTTEMQLDQRHLEAETLARMLTEAKTICRESAERYGCEFASRHVLSVAPTPFDPTLVALASSAVDERVGEAGEAIPSGPLHDASEIGRVVPTAMLFAQSNPPISHAPIEDSSQDALEAAIDAFGGTVQRILENADTLISQGG